MSSDPQKLPLKFQYSSSVVQDARTTKKCPNSMPSQVASPPPDRLHLGLSWNSCHCQIMQVGAGVTIKINQRSEARLGPCLAFCKNWCKLPSLVLVVHGKAFMCGAVIECVGAVSGFKLRGNLTSSKRINSLFGPMK